MICSVPDVQIFSCSKLQEKERGAEAVAVLMPPGMRLRISSHTQLFLFLVAFYAFIHLLLSSLSPSTAEETGVTGDHSDPGLSSPQRVTISKIPSGIKANLR